MKMAESIVNFKMKEDEFESLFMVIENIMSKKKINLNMIYVKYPLKHKDF